ncbi:recombinase family protein [Streptomyces sp. TP-A0356]|uniref:recombinase family protein n=1 Tax=Streptomyces sp. TP-A0356 TaxID=1359208 RepID=UPI0006E350CD|nr:recombinase family protein [Streptomyces sp. TP-A0356]
MRDEDGAAITAVTVACPKGCTAEPDLAEGSEAWHLRDATRMVADGQSVRSVLRTWQAAGVRTPARRKRLPDGTRTEPTPGDWTPTTLLKLLRRPRNAGIMEVDGAEAGRGAWLPVVDEETWRICDAVLKSPARRTTPGPTRKYLGGGLYRCHCGGPVQTTGRGTSRNGSVYTCRTGGHVSRQASAVDEHAERIIIAQIVWETVRDPFWPPAPQAQPSGDLSARHAALTARLRGLAEAFADDDDSDPVEYRSAARRIKEKIAAVEQQMAEAVAASAAAGRGAFEDIDLPELVKRHQADPDEALTWWRGAYSLERRREIVAVLSVVTILPATSGRTAGWAPGSKYFNPESVRIEWTGAA